MKMPQDVHSSASVDAAHNKVLAAGSVLEFASPDNPCHSHGGRQLYTRPAFQRFPDRVAVMGRCHIPNVCASVASCCFGASALELFFSNAGKDTVLFRDEEFSNLKKHKNSPGEK